MKRVWIAVVMAALLGAAAGHAQKASISWVVAGEQGASQDVDKQQAEEIYRAAVSLVEEQMEWNGRPLRPRITVHIGEACPAREVEGPCMNPLLGVLYVDQWNEEARDALARITMLTTLQQIVEPGEPQRFI